MSKEVSISAFKPHSRQKDIIRALQDQSTFYTVVVCGRQFGKTKLAMAACIKWALENKNINVLWVAPTSTQLETVYKELVNLLHPIGCIKSKKGSKGSTQIEFTTGSRLLFRSAASKDSLRGSSIHYMVLDECAWIDEETVNTILLPMFAVTGRKLLCISSPKGKNWFYRWFLNGQSNDYDFTRWKSFRFSSYDNPYVKTENVDEWRTTMSDGEFRQEVLAEFVDKASVFENVPELCVLDELNDPIKDGQYFAGIDIGLINDATVLSIIDNNGNLVKYYRWKHISSPLLIQTILEINEKWKFRKILIEVNGQGQPIYQELRRSIRNVEDFTTTSRSKTEIINNLIHHFKMKKMLLVNDGEDSQMKRELEGFIFTQKGSSYIKYEASSGLNDDCVMSLAIARDCYERYRFNARFTAFF